MDIPASLVKTLREKSGAGMMDCKNALVEMEGDLEKALDHLRQKGLADAANKAGRTATEGLVYAYIHAGGKIGVLLEVNCETDFVALTPQFQEFVKDVAMQVDRVMPGRGVGHGDQVAAVTRKGQHGFHDMARGRDAVDEPYFGAVLDNAD